MASTRSQNNAASHRNYKHPPLEMPNTKEVRSFHWWADVPAEKHDMIFAPDQTTTFGEPSVKYRGMFINDEAPALTG